MHECWRADERPLILLGYFARFVHLAHKFPKRNGPSRSRFLFRGKRCLPCRVGASDASAAAPDAMQVLVTLLAPKHYVV